MGTKRVVNNAEFIVDGDLSGDITSDSIDIMGCDRVGLQLVWTGAAVGTFEIQVSNDDTNWIGIGVSTVAPAGAGDEGFIDAETAARYVRLFYDSGSSTGTLQAHIVAKSISA